MKKLILLPLLVLAALVCNGCATPSVGGAQTASPSYLQTAGKSLLAVKSSIVTAATAADTLCRNGVMAAKQCQEAKLLYEKSKPVYDSAVDAYILLVQGAIGQTDFDRSLQRVQNIADNMLQLAGGAK